MRLRFKRCHFIKEFRWSLITFNMVFQCFRKLLWIHRVNELYTKFITHRPFQVKFCVKYKPPNKITLIGDGINPKYETYCPIRVTTSWSVMFYLRVLYIMYSVTTLDKNWQGNEANGHRKRARGRARWFCVTIFLRMNSNSGKGRTQICT